MGFGFIITIDPCYAIKPISWRLQIDLFFIRLWFDKYYTK